MSVLSPHDKAVLKSLRARGIDISEEMLVSERLRKMDDEVRGYIELMRKPVSLRLHDFGWTCRYEGEDGIGCWDHIGNPQIRMIHSAAREDDGQVWSHVSLSRKDGIYPTWEQQRDVFRLIHPDQPGVIVVSPASEHVNIAEVAHVWCCLTQRTVPDFSSGTGTI